MKVRFIYRSILSTNREGRAAAIEASCNYDKLTRIVMDARKLENFDAERAYDKEILVALAHPRRARAFSKLAPMGVGKDVGDVHRAF